MGDILGLRRAAERNAGDALAYILARLPAKLLNADFTIELRPHVGLDEPRTHAVDADTVASERRREASGETDHRGLAHRIRQCGC